MKAITFSKSKEGRQPVRIACYMALATEPQAKSLTDHLADLGAMVKSITTKAAAACNTRNLVTALSVVAAATAWGAAMLYELQPTTWSLITLAISAVTAISALTAIYWKGGEV